MRKDAFTKFEYSLKKPDISMAPLIDMVFLLLIFFAVTTTFTKETGIKVDKAQATTSQQINKNLMVIAIHKEGTYWYDKKQHPLDEIVSLVINKYHETNDLNIVIVPDKNGRIEPLVMLMDRLRARDINQFSLGTQLSGEQQ
jgi:biopolymer transport protein ExbD